MKILLHVCCGPCAIYPLQTLRQDGFEVMGYFNNPNIHPYREFKRRIASVKILSSRADFPVEICTEYGLREYLRKVVFQEEQRCPICYSMRLEEAAQRAVDEGFSCFTTTLLYSKYQNHHQIKEIGERVAKEKGIDFYYRDFRKGWQYGIDQSLELDLYRQPYCGCIYSEEERYDKRFRKKMRKKNAQHNCPGNKQ